MRSASAPPPHSSAPSMKLPRRGSSRMPTSNRASDDSSETSAREGTARGSGSSSLRTRLLDTVTSRFGRFEKSSSAARISSRSRSTKPSSNGKREASATSTSTFTSVLRPAPPSPSTVSTVSTSTESPATLSSVDAGDKPVTPYTRRIFQPSRKRILSDPKGDYIFCEGEIIADRYEIKRSGPIGSGAFGIVVEALDLRTNQAVAVKLIKARPKFAKQAECESQLLQRMRSHPDFDRAHVVEWVDHFKWGDHECIVFERLSQSLYDVLAMSQFKGVSLNLVRKFAKQLVKSLNFLRHPGVNIIHCDLKPENILLCEPSSKGRLKLIDFGSSCMTHKQLHKYIQSRWYRAPEILLGVEYGAEVDVWSVACILAELHTGRPLFPGGHQPLTKRSPSHDMLCRFSSVLGPVPEPMLEEAAMVATKVKAARARGREPTKRLTGVDMTDRSFHYELSAHATTQGSKKELGTIFGATTWGPRCKWQGERHHSQAHYKIFIDFVDKMLRFNPAERATPADLLQHPFLNDKVWTYLANRPTESDL